MSKQLQKLAEGWVLDASTKLYHYYQEEAEQAAHPALCQGPALLTGALRQRAAALPEGLKPRYAQHNQSINTKQIGICKACSNRHANLK